MSISTWTGAVSSDWADADNWSPAGLPGASSDVVIDGGTPTAVASASIGTVNSITDFDDLRFGSAGTNTVTTFLDNSFELRVDRKAGAGGTILNIGGTLTNSGSLRIGNATLSAPDTVSAASLDNTASGEIRMLGSRSNQALLDVTGSAGFGATGVLSGSVELTGDSAIEFTSGQITSLAGSLVLNGSDAFIEDSTGLGSNSALAGLASIGAGAYFELHNAAVSTIGALANDGVVLLDADAIGEGGSSLTVAGPLTNGDVLYFGNYGLSKSDEVTATSLDNTGGGTIELTGNGENLAALNVSGATTNNGLIGITYDTEELAGAVGGAGSFILERAHLQFDSSVSAGQTIQMTNALDNLILKQAQSFGATISGFGTGDTIDATNFLKTATTFNFVENSGGTGGTLTLHDGSLTANILMTRNYSNSSFSLAPDSGTGPLVKFV